MNIFLTPYNKHFPIKVITIKDKHAGKPYITRAIKNCIKHRNKLQALYANWPLTYGNIFKNYRNTIISLVRAAKEKYHQSYLKEHTGDVKKTWDFINRIMGKNKAKLLTSITFKNKTTSNNQDIAEEFNEYFSRVGDRLAQDVQPTIIPFNDYLPEPVLFSFYLWPTTTTETTTLINTLKGTSSVMMKSTQKLLESVEILFLYFLNILLIALFEMESFLNNFKLLEWFQYIKRMTKTIAITTTHINLACFQ